MNISGKTWTCKEVLQRVGRVDQLGGTRHYVLDEGAGKGISAIDVNTGAGLAFTVLPDRGLDISRASYRGTSLVYLTPNGEVNPAFYDAQGIGWLHTFFGGLLTTCGLTHMGHPCQDGDDALGLHGPYSTIPARRVNDLSRWEGDEYIIEITGVIEECALFGDKVRLTRTISTSIGASSLTISDRVENFGYASTPFMILYHINPGFPLLDACCTLQLPSKEVVPYNDQARDTTDPWSTFSTPTPGFEEQCFSHTLEPDANGHACVTLENPELHGGLAFTIDVDTSELPYLNEWKMMGQGDYVLGLEPSNLPLGSRAMAREKGILPMLEPGETKDMSLEIGVQ